MPRITPHWLEGAALPKWNVAVFGCLPRDGVSVRSLMRTVISGSLPLPFVSRTGDTQAPLELDFDLDLSDAAFSAWQQWCTYELHDGSLPFTMYLPWGTRQPSVRARLIGPWSATHGVDYRWRVAGVMEIERESLPRLSGGALPQGIATTGRFY